jgi:hypothetical protein
MKALSRIGQIKLSGAVRLPEHGQAQKQQTRGDQDDGRSGNESLQIMEVR